ncbi:hypothetical protein F4779DRAFT_642591 [Xylariaceae sp. FL0662B]|nr:hypothetical protein F4779DRAFT_642591 [Xylariaceae sp. FL0662B]
MALRETMEQLVSRIEVWLSAVTADEADADENNQNPPKHHDIFIESEAFDFSATASSSIPASTHAAFRALIHGPQSQQPQPQQPQPQQKQQPEASDNAAAVARGMTRVLRTCLELVDQWGGLEPRSPRLFDLAYVCLRHAGVVDYIDDGGRYLRLLVGAYREAFDRAVQEYGHTHHDAGDGDGEGGGPTMLVLTETADDAFALICCMRDWSRLFAGGDLEIEVVRG